LILFFGIILAASFLTAYSQVSTRGIEPHSSENPLKELLPGHRFVPPQIAAQQADDFDNPAFPLVLEAEKLFAAPDGAAGRSCASCHAPSSNTVPINRAAASYPKYHERARAVVTLEQRINLCRQTFLRAPEWEYDSPELIGMTAYVKHLARGTPHSITTSGPGASTFDSGRKLFEARAGRLQLSCAQCHNDRYGQVYSGETLSQGHPVDYPLFDQSEGRVIGLHERFRICNALARAEPKPLGSEEYVALEMYLSWRSQNLPIEAPGVRP
jgi:sulfur-oxidizing protein SoxA